MSKISADGEQIAGVEASDINDGDIISGTGQEFTEDKTQYRFTYTLRSGRVITSDWLSGNADHRKLRHMWIGAVRDQEIADSSTAASAAIKVARDLAMGTPAATQAVPTTPPRVDAPAVSQPVYDSDEDPKQVIVRRIIAAQDRTDRAQWEYDMAAQNKKAADAALSKWQKLLEAV